MKRRLSWLLIMFIVSAPAWAQDSTYVKLGDTTFVKRVDPFLISTLDTANAIKKEVVVTTEKKDTSYKVASPKKDEPPVTTTPGKNWDTRWFISPLLKFQAQDFGMLEKNKLNHLSNAHALPFMDKSNLSFAASAYKNFSGRLSGSLDVGFSKGHVSATNELIENTPSKTYNLLNATLYFHLLSSKYRLQPFIAAGINTVISDSAYTSSPVGAGVKFTSKKIMITAQASYGHSIKRVSNSMIYSLGIYIPFKQKKKKEDDNKSDSTLKKDEKNTTNVVNNYYFMTNPNDSLKSKDSSSTNAILKGLDDKLGGNQNGNDNGKNKIGANDNKDGNTDGSGEDMNFVPRPYDPNDPMTFPKAKKFTIYFNYDEYGLTSEGFREVDRVIGLMNANPKLKVHLKGHTDLRGSENYNMPLSKRRAQIVYDYMLSRGISTERMIMSHYGKELPVVKKSGGLEGEWQNRRTEMVLFENNESEMKTIEEKLDDNKN